MMFINNLDLVGSTLESLKIMFTGFEGRGGLVILAFKGLLSFNRFVYDLRHKRLTTQN